MFPRAKTDWPKPHVVVWFVNQVAGTDTTIDKWQSDTISKSQRYKILVAADELRCELLRLGKDTDAKVCGSAEGSSVQRTEDSTLQ